VAIKVRPHQERLLEVYAHEQVSKVVRAFVKANNLRGDKLVPALEDYVLTKIGECGGPLLPEQLAGGQAVGGPEKTVQMEKPVVGPPAPPNFFQFQPQQ